METGPGRWIGCTIVRAGEWAKAAVLATSFRQFHPGTPFAVLMLDRPDEKFALPGATVLYLGDIGLEKGEEWRLPMLHGADQLRALVQPALLQCLLQANDLVAYFEASTLIFGPIFDVVALANNHPGEIVSSGSIQNDFGDSGRSFYTLTSQAQAALSAWSQLLIKMAQVERDAAAFSTKNFDSLFDSLPHQVISSPGFAVSYATLDPETLTFTSEGYQIEGRPLRTFDFRGYEADKPHLLSKCLGLEPGILLSEYPILTKLCDSYLERLLQASYQKDNTIRPGCDSLPSGLPIDARMLRIYRKAFDEWRARRAEEPPSPYGAAGEAGFLRWLNQPIDRDEKFVTRYMLGVYDDRGDLKNAFPDPLGEDAARFRDWYLMFGQKELALPAALVPSPESGTELRLLEPRSIPVNLAGYFRAELGLGSAARSLFAALEAAQIPCNTISFDRTANRLNHPFTEQRSPNKQADINIVCINPDQLSSFVEQTGPDLWHGRYTIGVWFWEVEDFPASYHSAFNYVDEIWVASNFMRETFLKVSPKPVFKYRLPVSATSIDRSLDRAHFGLPNQFTFLFSYDFLSVLERKNPVGLSEAFAKAFAPSEGPVLVIKTINGDKRTLEMEKLKYAIRGRSDIILRDGYLSAAENASLTALADCYVSLHRSEGFGLTIAEAMALGKPAIATAYSGNLEFMTPDNSYLCPFHRCNVGAEREPYPAESHWAAPDGAAGAGMLRHVYEHQAEAKARGARAAQDMRSLFAPAVAGKIISDRLGVIRRRRADPGPKRSIGFLQDRLEELGAHP
jgi:hypothetical protein